MKIGYVCTNYNNSEFTVTAVQTLLCNKKHDCEVVVVDNQSDENNSNILRDIASQYSAVHVIFNRDNVGYFRGLNQGIQYLRDNYSEIKWMVIGNNDLEFPPDFLDRVAKNSDRLSSYAVISPDITTGDGEHQNPHVISRISGIREIFYDLYYANYYLGALIYKLAKMLPILSDRPDEKQWKVAQSIYQGHGSCYILGPRFFEQFTMLWAPTFLMAEEFFLSKQLSDAGQKIYYDPAIRVIHRWHASLEKIPKKQQWSLARDAHREYRKHVKIFR